VVRCGSPTREAASYTATVSSVDGSAYGQPFRSSFADDT
jgi:hypothetical protein